MTEFPDRPTATKWNDLRRPYVSETFSRIWWAVGRPAGAATGPCRTSPSKTSIVRTMGPPSSRPRKVMAPPPGPVGHGDDEGTGRSMTGAVGFGKATICPGMVGLGVAAAILRRGRPPEPGWQF